MALLLRKGSFLHKVAGRLFMISIILMVPIISAETWLSPCSISPLGILFVFFITYLVTSAWSTIYHPEGKLVTLDKIAPLVALGIFIAGLILGFDATSNPSETESSHIKEAYFFFSAIAFIAMLLDANNLKKVGVRGNHRVVRHVWRMCCAMFFAVSTLFTGPGSIVFPESLRGNPLLSIPELLVVLLAAYWIYRLIFLKQRFLPKNTTPDLK
ncbi:hypothetical protein [Psychromonas antarctica]|uniref:hypothetical protein n=1 Tax=Psychromonas antarctica TaxID=67573 RepID=UPI001EE8A656|nr:hypothetical protein [Psychromonas antarctica]MCG6202183.1 hypothetical protein [Psychromonas antarctica]